MRRAVTWQVLLLAAVFSLGAKNENAAQKQDPAKTIKHAVSSDPAINDFKKMQKEAALIIENILTAMNEKRYSNYCRDFNESMKSAYTEDVFKTNTGLLEESIGTYVSKTPDRIEKIQQHYVFYFNAKFTKARGPVIVRLVLEKPENKLQVALLSFDAPELKELKVKQRKWWRLWLF
jgi:hypothetical protein